jgi:Tfp pilus assembly major pilin PilA
MIEIMIAIIVISVCVAIATGTVVYYLLNKKYSTKFERLEGRMTEDERLFSKLYDEYREHYYKKHG